MYIRGREEGLANCAADADFGSGEVTLDGGGLQWATGTTSDISPQLGPLGAGGATFDTNGNDVTLASSLNGLGSVVKAGAGTLTLAGASSFTGDTRVTGGELDVTGTLPSTLTIATGGVAEVSGTVSGAITVLPAGTLNCDGGTITGGVDSDGVTTGAPDSPSALSAQAGNGVAVVGFTPGAGNCFPVSYTATATPSGESRSASSEPITVRSSWP